MPFDFKRYRQENREKNRRYQKRYYIENRELFLKRSMEYRKTHEWVMKEKWK